MVGMITEALQGTTVDLTGPAKRLVYVKRLLDDVCDPWLMVGLRREWARQLSIVSGQAGNATMIGIMTTGLCEHLYEMHHEMHAHLLGIPATREIPGISANALSREAMLRLWQWSLAERHPAHPWPTSIGETCRHPMLLIVQNRAIDLPVHHMRLPRQKRSLL
jgi:hypothetical protein